MAVKWLVYKRTQRMYMLVPRYQNGQNRDIRIENRSLENWSQYKHFEKRVKHYNLMQKEIKNELEFR
jgi:hypothetical protein